MNKWRAEVGGEYWYISPYVQGDGYSIESHYDYRHGPENRRYEVGNYFQTKLDATKAAQCIMALLQTDLEGDVDKNVVVVGGRSGGKTFKYGFRVGAHWATQKMKGK